MTGSEKPPKPKFLFDENVSAVLARYLREFGCDVTFAPKGLKNGFLASLARTEERVLVTHDKDFLAYPIEKTFGIIFLKFHPPIEEEMFEKIKTLLSRVSFDDLTHRRTIVQRD